MVKKQNSRNLIRYVRNVGRVPISMGDGLKKNDIFWKNMLDHRKSKIIGPKRVPTWGPYWPTGVFLQTPVLYVRVCH